MLGIVLIAGMLAGVAVFSMPVLQTTSAQCNELGNPDKGAEVNRCEAGHGGVICKDVITPDGNTVHKCHRPGGI